MAFVPSLTSRVEIRVPNFPSTPATRNADVGSSWTKLPLAPLGYALARCHTYRRHTLRARPKEPPAPWNLVEAPVGSIKSWYYWNQDTGETSWDPPTSEAKAQAPGRWRAVNRPEDGAVYYYNEVTMETSWSLPKDAVLLDDEVVQLEEKDEEDAEDAEDVEDVDEDVELEEEDVEELEEDMDEEDMYEEASPSTGSRAVPPSKETDYSNLKVVELKELLSSRGLKVGGRKVELIARLQESDGILAKEVAKTTSSVSKPKVQKKDGSKKKSTAIPKTAVKSAAIPKTAVQFLEQELSLDSGLLRLPKEASIDKVKSNLNFLLEELMPSKDFWAEAALTDSKLFLADVDDMNETLQWLEEFLWNQDWAVGFGRHALAERIRHRPFLLLQGVEELTKTLAWLEEHGLDDEVVRSYVASPTAVPYPCEPYPWIELLQLGTEGLQEAETWLTKKQKWTTEQVSNALCQEPYILLAAATAGGGGGRPYPGYPLPEPRENWLQTHAQATS